MNTIQVNSLPFKEVLLDFARSFDTECIENCEEYYVELSEKWGRGSIRGINFDGGLGLIFYQCEFNEAIEIKFVVNEVHPLKYLFCLEGELNHRFGNHTDNHVLLPYQNSMVGSENHDGHILQFKKGVFTEIFSLEVDRKKFSDKMNCELQKADAKLKAMFMDVNAKSLFYYQGFYSFILAGLFEEIKDFKETGLINKIFLEGKAHQILANQLLQYTDDYNAETERQLLRQTDVRAVREAVTLIENSIDNLGSVGSLAHSVGLNPNKLQNGFKMLYGMTVNEYIQKIRLENAKSLLLKTHFSIQEIMEKVGLNSKSYFSKLFRDAYDMTPTDFRKKHLPKE